MTSIEEMKRHLSYCISLNRGLSKIYVILNNKVELNKILGEIHAYENALRWLNEIDETELIIRRKEKHEIEY